MRRKSARKEINSYMGFSLSNFTSINLNYLIYLLNLYDNCMHSGGYKFPWLDIDGNVFLIPDLIEKLFEELWNNILDSDNIAQNDYEYWESKRFPYISLLADNPNRLSIYEFIKKTFEHWYWGSSNQLCNMFSDNLVERYYYDLLEYAQNKGMELKNQMFYLQTLYNAPRNNWITIKGNIIIVSPDKPLPVIDDVSRICVTKSVCG